MFRDEQFVKDELAQLNHVIDQDNESRAMVGKPALPHLKFGSKVYVPNYGDAVAADTGGAIKGNRVDLCMENYSECFDFGVRYVDVFVHY